MTDRIFKLKDDAPRAYRGLGIAARKGETFAAEDDAHAELILETGYFEEVEAGGVDVAETQPADDETESNTVRAAAAEADDGRDPNDAEEFDEDAWFDRSYRDRAAAVEGGEADGYLAEIAEAETSDTVLDAVADRREDVELESGIESESEPEPES